jgi:hypothetical protein
MQNFGESALYRTLSEFTGRLLGEYRFKGEYPQGKIPIALDVPDASDAN